MKKLSYIFILCSIFIQFGIVLMNASANDVFLKGDANGDGEIGMPDIMFVVNCILGNPADNFNAFAADANCDGEIGMSDVMFIVNHILGKNEEHHIDTLRIVYNEKTATISNYDENRFQVSISNTSVKLKSTGKRHFACIVEGNCRNGNLTVDADTTFTMVLSNLHLASEETAVICLPQKQKADIIVPIGTKSFLIDGATRTLEDKSVNGCLHSKGTLAFMGKGTLSVTGNYRHGIVSSKNISVEGCHLTINYAVKNGIHCDNFTLKDGFVDLYLQNDASKGIKVKEKLVIKSGVIEGKATGSIINEDGDLSYSSLLKSDGTIIVSGGTLTLKQYGDGGRCISADKDLTMTAGTMNLECHGGGGQYTNADNELDYYTPKCITVDDSVKIVSGTITCLSTGVGGKGIVAGKYLSIGNNNKNENVEEPVVRVETQGECIINDENEDQRFGCPKGIKSDSILVIYDGDILVTTKGMGGEGVESNDSMYVCGGKLECITFDDGINVAKSIEIAGGQVYCNSENNDGIDSNGCIRISGGIVASVNQTKPNESFDSEGGQFYMTGGTILGIGSGPVDVKETTYPCYNTPYDSEDDIRSKGLIITEGKYICMQKGTEVTIALRNDNKAFRTFVTVMSPSFTEGETFVMSEGDKPIDIQQSYFDGRLILNGKTVNNSPILDIQVLTIK